MSELKKKKKASDSEKASEKKSLEKLADVILENLKESESNDVESFELYAQQLRSHIHSDPQAFREKFLKGYQALFDELENPPKS